MLKLSEKFRDFLFTTTERDYLEGTTAAGKTTVGIAKFLLMVAKSDKANHVIAGADLGTVEKNVINSELGILAQFKGLVEYYGNGKGNRKLPHLEYETARGTKIIYVCGYDNKKRWQKVLGSQMGCVYIDEVNIADMEFVREITHRCDYMMTTSNPDDPNMAIYKEFLNRSRPLKKYEKDYPRELLEQLDQPPVKGWTHWYFTFYDNASMDMAAIQKKIDAVAVGTKMYKNKILGLRGKASGLVFVNFNRKKHVITKEEAKRFIKRDGNQEYFEWFTSGMDTAYSSKTPDTIAMSFIGITNKGRCIVLDEKVYNNADLNNPIAPSDTVVNYIAFLDRNSDKWGFAKNTFIDSADQATLTELAKYKRAHPECLYAFNNAHKSLKIINRIKLQLGWLSYNDKGKEPSYFIVDTCKEYIRELECYSWKEDKDEEPEDANDHMINSTQYGWIPFRDKIGKRG